MISKHEKTRKTFSFKEKHKPTNGLTFFFMEPSLLFLEITNTQLITLNVKAKNT